MSITKQDIKVLRQTSSKLFRLACTIGISLIIIVFLTGAVNNIRLCHRFAVMAGFTVGQVFNKWITGISESETQLEIVLLAVQRLQMALGSLAIVALLAVALWVLLSTSYRNARILKALKIRKR
ncbi:MAG: hypothetical protein A2Y65_03955 [Deltaproteobacteria bacterium RBG_13_52_11]|nr:MAG: hypothetical protein A2Y65_03955 [Deltaproteobacteria bacterium RBG_13_52_11]